MGEKCECDDEEDNEGEKIVVVPGREGMTVQEGEKGALRAAGGAGETGEAAEETRGAPRETGEVAPKPNEEESEQNENKCAAVRHGGLVRCGGEAGVLFDKGRIRALCAQWIGAVRPFFAYRQKKGEWAKTLFLELLELRDGGKHGLVVIVEGGIHNVDQVYQPPKATATAGQQFADANSDVFEDESVDAQSAGEEGKHCPVLFYVHRGRGRAPAWKNYPKVRALTH